ncbi:hypothetical protein RB195_011987 [Necator americanus]|uniref:Uncharacterized protein n=1 Tax=Necator americanus TaxID=51031 RepID=A0ABR1D4X5_NECAM
MMFNISNQHAAIAEIDANATMGLEQQSDGFGKRIGTPTETLRIFPLPPFPLVCPPPVIPPSSPPPPPVTPPSTVPATPLRSPPPVPPPPPPVTEPRTPPTAPPPPPPVCPPPPPVRTYMVHVTLEEGHLDPSTLKLTKYISEHSINQRRC